MRALEARRLVLEVTQAGADVLLKNRPPLIGELRPALLPVRQDARQVRLARRLLSRTNHLHEGLPPVALADRLFASGQSAQQRIHRDVERLPFERDLVAHFTDLRQEQRAVFDVVVDVATRARRQLPVASLRHLLQQLVVVVALRFEVAEVTVGLVDDALELELQFGVELLRLAHDAPSVAEAFTTPVGDDVRQPLVVRLLRPLVLGLHFIRSRPRRLRRCRVLLLERRQRILRLERRAQTLHLLAGGVEAAVVDLTGDTGGDRIRRLDARGDDGVVATDEVGGSLQFELPLGKFGRTHLGASVGHGGDERAEVLDLGGDGLG